MSLHSSTPSSEPGLGRRILLAWRWWIVPIAIVTLLWIAAMTFAQRGDEGPRRTYTVM